MNSTPGVTGRSTARKQEDFAKLMEINAEVNDLIFKKYNINRPYYYIDFFAGPGYLTDIVYDGPGSPLIAARALSHYDLDYKIILYEKDPSRREMLLSMPELQGAKILTDCSLVDPRGICNKTRGLAYFDPNMTEVSFKISFSLMEKLARVRPKLDLMLYLACNSYFKRGVPTSIFNVKRAIDPIEKKHWIIRELDAGEQYTFLIGTNYPSWAKWGKAGFYDIKSKRGQEIFNKCNCTKREIENGDC